MSGTELRETQQLTAQDQLEHFVAQTDLAIGAAKEKYEALIIVDLDDRDSANAVTVAHKECKKIVAAIESTRKALKEDALAWGRTVDGQAKRLKGELQPLLEHLKLQRDKVDAEKERKRQEREQAEAKQLQSRVDCMQEVNGDVSNLAMLASLPDDVFADMLKGATEAFNLAEWNRAEEQRFKEIREAAEKEDREQAEALRRQEEAAAQATRDQAEAELRERQAEIERKEAEHLERQAALDAEIEARREAERQQLQATADALRAKREAEAEQERAARAEQLKPVRDQLVAFANTITALPIPEGLAAYNEELSDILNYAAANVVAYGNELE